MQDKKAALQARIQELEELIQEQEKRIPPHSVQPSQFQELERLEEEKQRLQKELESF
jgi:hypothetical protein